MPQPDLNAAKGYLGDTNAWDDATVASALASEAKAQRRRCRVPAVGAEWPEDLAEALCRRVAVNLALRSLPLAVQATVTEAGASQTRVGGRDPEVRRLEAPFRKAPIG